jgi:hypothetical protein
MYNSWSDSLTLINSTISGNSFTAGEGGGIFNSTILTATNSTISSNAGTSGGGQDLYIWLGGSHSQRYFREFCH